MGLLKSARHLGRHVSHAVKKEIEHAKKAEKAARKAAKHAAKATKKAAKAAKKAGVAVNDNVLRPAEQTFNKTCDKVDEVMEKIHAHGTVGVGGEISLDSSSSPPPSPAPAQSPPPAAAMVLACNRQEQIVNLMDQWIAAGAYHDALENFPPTYHIGEETNWDGQVIPDPISREGIGQRARDIDDSERALQEARQRCRV